MTTIAPPAETFTAADLHAAAERAAAEPRLWAGLSGEQSTGEAVARHLEATKALLDADGWARTYGCTKPADLSAVDDDSATVKTLLRSLLRFIRAEIGDSRRPLKAALRHVGSSGQGDTDTAYIAEKVLDLIVRAHTGTDAAWAAPWAGRQGRAYADVAELLGAGARFARTHGPGSTAAAA